jgi:hypothetical protein
VCARAGEVAADDAGFKTLRALAEEKRAKMAGKAEERRERARRAAEEKKRIEVAFAVRVPLPPSSSSPLFTPLPASHFSSSLRYFLRAPSFPREPRDVCLSSHGSVPEV